MSYVERLIDLQFGLGGNQTFADGSTSGTFTGLRVSATISKAGAAGMNNISMRVYGLTPDVANQITTLGKPLVSARNNSVTVLAGDVTGGMATAFIGTIQQAWQDFSEAPDSAVQITGFTGAVSSLRPIKPNSYKGPTDAAVVLAQLATYGGFAFENNGVSVIIPNQYYSGSIRDQIKSVAHAAHVNWIIDDVNGTETLAIWPMNGVRTHAVPTISVSSGMAGYPAWTENGVIVRTLYNPQIVIGGNVAIDSLIKQAVGTWTVFGVTHEIESQTPGGKWFSTLTCNILGLPQVPR